MSRTFEVVSIGEAAVLTGLPPDVVQALAISGEIPAEHKDGELYVGKSALLGWCGLFAKIFSAVSDRHKARTGLSARHLVWLAQAGLLSGRERISL